MYTVYCLFEQSGTFKNEFRKLGINAFDYDILNHFGETDVQIDLFKQIEFAYNNEHSLFDLITPDDLIFAFFPCTRFEAKIPLWFRGEASQQKNWSIEKKLEYAIYLHQELHEFYLFISKLVLVAIKHNLRLIIENPFTQPHYLTNFWCLKPSIIDKDRRENGDYMKKPTQYFFINIEPKHNLLFESINYMQQRNHDFIKKSDFGIDRQIIRSQISAQYANRFIRQYIIDNPD